MARFIIKSREGANLLFMGEAPNLRAALQSACGQLPGGQGDEILAAIRRGSHKATDMLDVCDSSRFSTVVVGEQSYFYQSRASSEGKNYRVEVWPFNPVDIAISDNLTELAAPSFSFISAYGDKFLFRKLMTSRNRYYAVAPCRVEKLVVGFHLWVWDNHPVITAIRDKLTALPAPDYSLFNGKSAYKKKWCGKEPLYVIDAKPFSDRNVGREFLLAALGIKKDFIIRWRKDGRVLFAGSALDFSIAFQDAVTRLSPEEAKGFIGFERPTPDKLSFHFETFNSDDYCQETLRGEHFFYKVFPQKKNNGDVYGYELRVWVKNPVTEAIVSRSTPELSKPDFMLFNGLSAHKTWWENKYASWVEDADDFSVARLNIRHVRLAIGQWGKLAKGLYENDNEVVKVHLYLNEKHCRYLSQADVAKELGLNANGRTAINRAESIGLVTKSLKEKCRLFWERELGEKE